MKPQVLILDEPTAGLDPKGRDDILGQIQSLYQKNKMTIILVSHSMEDIARLVNRIVVMHSGKIAITDTPREVFKRAEELEKLGLGIPQITYFMKAFKNKGHGIREDVLTVDEAKEEILQYLRRNRDA